MTGAREFIIFAVIQSDGAHNDIVCLVGAGCKLTRRYSGVDVLHVMALWLPIASLIAYYPGVYWPAYSCNKRLRIDVIAMVRN